MVDDQSVVLEWKLFPSRGTLSSGEAQQASQLYLPQWISATVHINNPQISYTTKVTIPHPLPLTGCKSGACESGIWHLTTV